MCSKYYDDCKVFKTVSKLCLSTECLSFFRRNLDYQEVLAKLAEQGISIRVASPKLVMEEVRHFIFINKRLFGVWTSYPTFLSYYRLRNRTKTSRMSLIHVSF